MYRSIYPSTYVCRYAYIHILFLYTYTHIFIPLYIYLYSPVDCVWPVAAADGIAVLRLPKRRHHRAALGRVRCPPRYWQRRDAG